ncbi:hypothetical protein Moror_3778 [Moniliophthora roreri MCA 2997]|uniref:Transmembrane protein n=1 Tax=Moniliophthora roreri (strain MCA 2997) TaxID=1381753 RepID=V2XXZ2_MONRO|nr:hypothetical protein Moror_3778 [Moniliophthora roreri MCA 2997]
MAVVFSSTGCQVLSSLVCLLGVSVLSHCLSCSLQQFSSWTSISKMTWPRWCITLIFVDSWLFLFASGIVVFGIGLETDMVACQTAIYICIAFYTTSKLLIYCLLSEKARVVWSPSLGSSRFRSPIYTLSMVMVAVYAGVIVLAVIGRVHFWRDDGVCVIGLKAYSSIPLLSYDAWINIFLNGLFLWPLLRSHKMSPAIKLVALRTLVASAAALTTSLINIAVLTSFEGHQLGWVCLGSCGLDVTLNAVAIYWATRRSSASISNSSEAVSRREGYESTQTLSKCSELVFAHGTQLTTQFATRDLSTSVPPMPESSILEISCSRPRPPSPIKDGVNPSILHIPDDRLFLSPRQSDTEGHASYAPRRYQSCLNTTP